MPTRREVLKRSALAGAGLFFSAGTGPLGRKLFAGINGGTPQLKKWLDPLLTSIPVLVPDTLTYDDADYYVINMAGGRFQFHSQLPVTAPGTDPTTFGYGGVVGPNNIVTFGYLGPTIEAQKGRTVVVKFINNLPPAFHPLQAAIDKTLPGALQNGPDGRATPHLHGGFTVPQFDGHPDSWFTPSGAQGDRYASLEGATVASNEAIYVYSNQQPATMLWYHDHAMGMTRHNAYAGLAALYFIRDEYDTGKDWAAPNAPASALHLPFGNYEIPLVIQDKQFNPDGSLFYPTVGVTPTHPVWVPEFFGDTPVVNGKAYPVLNVEPRRYRFRMVNGSQARFYNLFLTSGGRGNIPMHVIGMEQGLLSGTAAPLQTLLLAPGERADVIVDFTGIKLGTTIMLSNNANTPYPGGGKPAGANMPEILKINVVTPLAGTDATTAPGSLVLPTRPTLQVAGTTGTEVAMKETMDMVAKAPLEVRLNERPFMVLDGAQHMIVDEMPMEGTAEYWDFVNLTVDAHPMHMHLVQFQVVNRQPFNVAAYTTAYLKWVGPDARNPATKPVLSTFYVGGPIPAAPEESGWKDTAKAYPGQILRVAVKFDMPAATIPGSGPELDESNPDMKGYVYVYHCHILEHEENDMMRPFMVMPVSMAKSDAGDRRAAAHPTEFALEQNYPNPFNPETTIRFQLPQDTHVRLNVFNAVGQHVATLVNGVTPAGAHAVQFNAHGMASGVYFCRIEAGAFSAMKKMLLVR